jgi:predicted HicB family RNase H-like nuclease
MIVLLLERVYCVRPFNHQGKETMLKITKKKVKKTMTIYIDTALWEQVAELAKNNGVSTNSLICDLLQHGVSQATED